MTEFSIRSIIRLFWRAQFHTLFGVTLGFVLSLIFDIGGSDTLFLTGSASVWAWVAISSGLGMSLAHGFGYFNVFRVYPRKSDLFILLLSMPVAALTVTLLQRWLFEIAVVRFSEAVWCGLFSAVLGYSCHYFGTLLRSHFGPKRKIVVEALPEERDNLMKILISCKMDEAIQILTKNELKQHLLKGSANSIALIIISRHAVKHFEEDGVLIRAHLAGVPIVDIKTVTSDLTGRTRLEDSDLWSYVLGATPQTPALRSFGVLKMVIEPIVATCIAVVLSPIMIMLAILIKYNCKGPVLYRQVRTGYLGKNFTLIKFRSMRTDAEVNGPQWASKNDTRVTKIGEFMRRTRLDELPQLWNVIKGEMSFFGPRPERPEIYRDLKKEIPLFSMRTIVRPGITGWAQVLGGYAASVNESLAKLEYDLYYIQNMSPRLDLIILIKTAQVALFGHRNETIELDEHSAVVEMPAQVKKESATV